MTISAKIICDSVSETRITTFQLRYPRFIHAELMTHRVFSRNASSSRAIPVKRLIEDVIRDPVYPSFWGKNQPGMQAKEENNEPIIISMNGKFDNLSREKAWESAREDAIKWAKLFDGAGYHKQIVNRLLEPFSHINVVVTATEWNNWYSLRKHPDAQPEIRILAEKMFEDYNNSVPELLLHGEWHLPYITEEDRLDVSGMTNNIREYDNLLLKISTARCARVSYLTYEGKKTDYEKDIILHDQLVTQQPVHASPAEHQATPDEIDSYFQEWKREDLHGNFEGWIQYRKTIPNEYVPG